MFFGALYYVLLVVGFIWFFCIKGKKKKEEPKRGATSSTQRAETASRNAKGNKAAGGRQSVAQFPVQPGATKKSAESVKELRKLEPVRNLAMEDRQHDWLARQRAEEQRALRRCSEMFEMKMQHSRSCEAEALRRFHEEHCDAKEVRM